METDKAAEYLKTLQKGERATLLEFLDDEKKVDLVKLPQFIVL